MDGRKRGEIPQRLTRAASRFAAWRRTHVPHSRIPKFLWTAAVKLAADFGISGTATALRLNYYDLKKHVESTAPPLRRASVVEHKPVFVEWPSSALPKSGDCIIELEHATGSKMRVHLKGPHSPDLVSLSTAFWNMPR